MVIAAGEVEEERPKKFPTTTKTTEERYIMALIPERSKNLHNFSSPPSFNLKWGRQKQLRCVKDAVESTADHYFPTTSSSPPPYYRRDFPGADRKRRSSPVEDGGRQKQLRCVKDAAVDSTADHYFPTSSSSPPPYYRRDFTGADRKRRSSPVDDGGGIEAVREKLILDLRTEVNQMKAAILNEGGSCTRNFEVVKIAPPPSSSSAAAEAAVVAVEAAAEVRPWNLRTRRAVCKEPYNAARSGRDRKTVVKSPRRSGEVDGDGGGGEKGPRAKFSVSLSKQEIEEDFLAIVGTRPARRPKKRPKHVQKQIDGLFPGSWLSEITADMYKVNEHPEA